MKGLIGGLTLFLILHTVVSNNFDVEDTKTNKTCLFARMNATFNIPYTMDNKNKSIAYVPVGDRASSAGKCAAANDTEASLTIFVGPTNTLKIGFVSKDNETTIDSVEYTFSYFKADFPNLPDSMNNKSATVSAKAMGVKLSPADQYYRCIAPAPLKLSAADKSLDVQLVLNDVLLQVFDVVDGKMSENKTECAGDVKTTPTTHTTPNSTHNMTTHHTTPDSNHTTHTNHTTQHTTEHTTHPHLKTTVAPSAHWYVRVNNTVCIVAEMNLTMTINYRDAKNVSLSKEIPLPVGAMVDEKLSSCGDEQVLVLHFFDDWSIRFNLTEEKSSFYVKGIQLDYTTDSHLPNASKSEKLTASESKLSLFKATKKNYYKCDASETQDLGDLVKLEFKEVKFQGYRGDSKNSTGLLGTAEECADDEKTSAIVPIVVGAALAALVVIVLIAYLVGRRRRQSGYESV